ncbi:MAG: hypothetical protein EOO65_05210 [Methanosarcinales archaeon]|nr:MAG: hypothetical protein EOO65_05210 [Methanosarcinales archaeon]
MRRMSKQDESTCKMHRLIVWWLAELSFGEQIQQLFSQDGTAEDGGFRTKCFLFIYGNVFWFNS